MAIGSGLVTFEGFFSQTTSGFDGSHPLSGLSQDDAFGFQSQVISPDVVGLDDTFTRRPNSHAYRFQCNSNASRYPSWQMPMSGNASVPAHVGVFYVYFNAADFSTLSELLMGVKVAGSAGTFWIGAGVQAGASPHFGIVFGLLAATSYTNGPVVSAITVTTGVWYRVEWRVRKDLGNPWQCDIGVATMDGTTSTASGNGPANNSITNNQQGILLGFGQIARTTQGRAALDMSFQDVAYGEAVADYPTGPVQVRAYKAASVGTHNLDAATSAFFFSEVGGVDTALTTSETTSWSELDDIPMTADDNGTRVEPSLGAINTPAFRAAGTTVFNANSVANPTALTPVKNAATVNGDVMVCITFCRSITATCAASAGWTVVSGFPKTSGTASGGRMYVFTKVANGTDTCTVTWTGVTTGTSGDSSSAVILSYSNATETFEAVSGTTIDLATTNTITLPSVTTTTDKDYCIAAAAVFLDSAQTGTVTTFTERSDASTTNGSGQFIYTADLVKTPAGATGTGTVTRSVVTSARTFGCTIAMKASRPTTQPTNTWYAEYGFEQEPTDAPIAIRTLVFADLDDTVTATSSYIFKARSGTTPTDVDIYNVSALAESPQIRGLVQFRAGDNATWTKALLNAAKVRFGFSSEATVKPKLSAALIEALFVSNVVSVGPRNKPIIVGQAVQRAAVR